MTPKKNDLTPQKAIKWFDELRKKSEGFGGSPDVKYKIRYMFRYAEKLMKLQVPMPPVNVDEDGHYFECPRCKQAFRSEFTSEDFKLCPECGQRFREGENHEVE